MLWADLVDYGPTADQDVTPPTSASSADQASKLMQTACTLDEIINEEKKRKTDGLSKIYKPIPRRRKRSPLMPTSPAYGRDSFTGQDMRTARSWRRAAPYIDQERDYRPRPRRRKRSLSTDECSSSSDSRAARRRLRKRSSERDKGRTIINVMQGGVLMLASEAGPAQGYFAGIPNALQNTQEMLAQYAYDRQQVRGGVDVTEICESSSETEPREKRNIIPEGEATCVSPIVTGTVKRRKPTGIIPGEIIELE